MCQGINGSDGRTRRGKAELPLRTKHPNVGFFYVVSTVISSLARDDALRWGNDGLDRAFGELKSPEGAFSRDAFGSSAGSHSSSRFVLHRSVLRFLWHSSPKDGPKLVERIRFPISRHVRATYGAEQCTSVQTHAQRNHGWTRHPPNRCWSWHCL
jgi:hypothetical protein